MLLAVCCPACGSPDAAPCPACVASMRAAPPVPCPPGLDRVAAALAYQGTAREVVAQLKYRNARAATAWLADGVAGLLAPGEVEVITWAPTTAVRRRARGFDHAELLARQVARRCGLPCRSLLVRSPGPPQTGRSLAERRRGPGFVARQALQHRVAVIDDVVTTGATLGAAGRALHGAGARWVVGLAAAHPP